MLSTEKLKLILVWDTIDGIRYQDLSEDLFPAAIEFLKNEYFPYSIYWNDIKDELEINEMCQRYLNILKDLCSVVAIDEDSGTIAGLVVARVMDTKDHAWSFWRIYPTKSQNIKTLTLFEYEMMDVGENSHLPPLHPLHPLHIFIICVARDMKGKYMKEQLFTQTSRMAYKLSNVDGITFISFTNNDYIRAERVGMKVIKAQHYKNFPTTSNNFHKFGNNNTASLHISLIEHETN